MSGLSEAVACYLATRRALGFRLEGAGRHLEQFAAFAEAAGAETVTTRLALQWATLPASRSRAWHAQRLDAVRGFARWLHAIDPQAQVPPAGLLPGSTRRATPYLYTEADITALMTAASRLNPPWKAATMETLTGLLFTTGVRLGEALSLERGDLDPATGLLTIRQAKFRKPRQLPLHPSAVAALAGGLPRSLKAIRVARAAARERAWALAGDAAPGGDGGLVTVDPDATIVIAHSEKEQASPTWKKTFGFHPVTAWADHGAGGNGEPLAIVLRPGNAGSNTAAGHIAAARLALAQPPRRLRRTVLVRAGSGGGTHEFLDWLTASSRRLHYSVGMVITGDLRAAIGNVPGTAWAPADDGDGQAREGAWAAGITGLLDTGGWPAGTRVIVRKERPHPGAQLRFTDIGGHRFTAFGADAKRGRLADLELRHRRRARCEDRIRGAKDTGLRNLPLKGYAQNQVWCEIVALASELLAWMQMLALTGTARRWEPKRLRLRVFAAAGRLASSGRRLRLRLAERWPRAAHITAAATRLRAIPTG